jgi:hypothetical protein
VTARYLKSGKAYLVPLIEVLVHETSHFRDWALRGSKARDDIEAANEEDRITEAERRRLQNGTPPQPGRDSHWDGKIVKCGGRCP